MPLLFAYRRWWCFLVTAILLVPAVGLVLPDRPAPPSTHPAIPPSWWVRAGTLLDPYLNEHFGLRGVVLAAHAAYGRTFKSTRQRPVLIGLHGQLFYTGDSALEQSLGRLFRAEQMDRLARATDRMRAELEEAGRGFVMVVPPNAQSILADHMPEWARHAQRHPTEYDAAARILPERSIRFVDLRTLFTAARAAGPVYLKTDTHWNRRGALLAFNATMRAAGLADLEVAPEAALGPPAPAGTGDLARHLGETRRTGDLDYLPKGPMLLPADVTPLPGIMPDSPPDDPFAPLAYETGHAGPRILVIGDSFTRASWPGLLAARSSAFAWMHHRGCRFDWSIVARFKPDVVIYAPVERALACQGWPEGLSPPAD